MKQYTTAERQRALKVLRESAKRAPDGTPNVTRCAGELGIDRRTLDRWWAAANPRTKRATATKEVAPEAPAKGAGWADPSPYLRQAAEELGVESLEDRRVVRLADTYAQRDASSSDTARAALTKEINRLVEDLHDGGGPRGAETPEEWKERAKQYPQLVAELVVEDAMVREHVEDALRASAKEE